MKLEAVELRHVRFPLVAPFRTASADQTERDVLILRALTDVGEGWGECGALWAPTYTSEHLLGARLVLVEWLVPMLLEAGEVAADDVASILGVVRGHEMAKAALELAVLDAELRVAGQPLAARLGATRNAVDAGVAIGLQPSVEALVEVIEGYVAEGYRRVKLKIEPGADLELVAAVRDRWPDLALQVDANSAYTRADADHLAELDAFGLQLIEQPLAADDLLGHAALARRLATPVCLDESVTSVASALTAIELGACEVLNLKPGRVGGHLRAIRIHDLCVEHRIPVWCGGMLETGIGRAANVALAALPGFTLPGDLSASRRYYAEDLTAPFELVDGQLVVPTGPGLGVDVRLDVLEKATVSVEVLRTR